MTLTFRARTHVTTAISQAHTTARTLKSNPRLLAILPIGLATALALVGGAFALAALLGLTPVGWVGVVLIIAAMFGAGLVVAASQSVVVTAALDALHGKPVSIRSAARQVCERKRDVVVVIVLLAVGASMASGIGHRATAAGEIVMSAAWFTAAFVTLPQLLEHGTSPSASIVASMRATRSNWPAAVGVGLPLVVAMLPLTIATKSATGFAAIALGISSGVAILLALTTLHVLTVIAFSEAAAARPVPSAQTV
jgi:hypothetical protein